MATLSGGERRKTERHERDDLTLRLSSANRTLPDVQLRNLSSAGFGVQLNSEIKVGQAVKFELEIPGDCVRGSGKVVWAEAFHMGYRGGIEITELGWFARRRLTLELNSQGGVVESVFDGLLLIAAGVLFAMVLVDLALHPEALKRLLLKLSGPR